MQMRLIFLFTVSLLLTGCGDRGGVAPVVESRWLAANAYQRVHQVQPGETLYAIAFRYDKDYRQLAAYNHLQRPYTLRVGQKIHVYPTVLKNNGNNTFDDVTIELGLYSPAPTQSASWGDFNNDGWEDLLVTNGFVTGPDKDDL